MNMKPGQTITHFLIEEQRQIEGATGEFSELVSDVVTACKVISNLVNKGELIGVLGSAGSENVQGETQKKLDILTNEVFIEANEWSGNLAAMASEEMDDIYMIPKQYPRGKYLLTFDPLDGSSNTDVNVSSTATPGDFVTLRQALSDHSRSSVGRWLAHSLTVSVGSGLSLSAWWLLRKMLEADPEKRVTATEALRSHYLYVGA